MVNAITIFCFIVVIGFMFLVGWRAAIVDKVSLGMTWLYALFFAFLGAILELMTYGLVCVIIGFIKFLF